MGTPPAGSIDTIPEAAQGFPTRDRKSKIWSVIRVSSGNFLEMYDFMVFGYYATAIGHAFFPSGNPFVSLMLSLMTFGAGFLMRPLGAIVLGAYTDRHGRRAGLILTLGLMSVGIISIACMPGYATIGLIAPLLVLLGRLLQGFSAGMELGGVSVYLSEIATPGHKGFYVSWQSASQQVAVMFAALLGVLLSSILPPEKMMVWGWRIPLLLGCVILPFLFRLRRSLQETDEFIARKHKPNISEILRCQLADRDHWNHAGDHDHGIFLHDHCLHADVRQFCASLGQQGQFDRHPVRWRIQSFLAACHGSAFRPDGPPPVALHLHHADVAHGLSHNAMAGARTLFLAIARGRTLAVVHLRQLQRRHGRLLDRDHAG
jgi:hypothetical protein